MSQKLSRHNNMRVRDLALYLTIFIVMPIITYFLGYSFNRIFQFPRWPPFPHNLVLGFTIFFSGLTLGIRASRQLLAQGRGLPWGELNRAVQSTHLVTSGFYAYCRHPITLGYTLLPCGMGLMFQSLGMSICIPLIVLLINILWLKMWEEPRLEQRFGAAYRHYKRDTPFLLPRLSFHTHLVSLWNLICGTSTPSPRLIYMLYSSFSICGVILLILLAYTPSLPLLQLPHQQILLLLGFDLICVGGIIASISPKWCSHLIFQQTLRDSAVTPFHQTQSHSSPFPRHGHHPDCGSYASHVLHLRNRRYCAGCLGLMIGAIFGILGSLPLLFGFTLPHAELYFWTGTGFVVLGIFQHQLSLFNNSWLHLSLNILFVIGPFFQLLGLFTLNPTLITELYLFTLIPFWILTRITFSQIQHAQICQTCTTSCPLQSH